MLLHERPMTRRIAALLVLLLSAAAPPVRAETWQAPGGGYAIDLPDGAPWTVVQVPRSASPELARGGTVVGRRTADGRRAAMLIVNPGVPEGQSFEETVAGFERGMFRDSPARKLSGTRFEIEGQPAYRFLARRPDGVWMGGVLLVRERVAYAAQVMKADGDPTRDDALVGFLESIRLP